MLNCQHIRPLFRHEKVPYIYVACTPQPLRVRFSFLPKYTHRSSIGNVAVFISVSGLEYGPYVTSIVTTTNVWNERMRLKPSRQAELINAQVRGLNCLLEKSWNALLTQPLPITGEMILAQAGLVEKEVSNA